MAGIGHNKASHQLETVELEGIPVTLYKRSDHNDPKWQMRIKVPGSTKSVRESTKCKDFERAKEVAMERYFEIKLQLKNNIPVFSKTFGELCREILKDVTKKFERGEITKESLAHYKSKIEKFYIPFFGRKQISAINQATVDDFWDWRIDYWKNEGRTIKGPMPDKDHTPKASTLHNESTILNMVLTKAITKGLMPYHKKPNHKPPVKNVKDRRSELTREEYMKLSRFMLNWVMKDRRMNILYSRDRLRYLIKIAVNSGMRPPEFYNLKWSDYTKQKDPEDGFEWTELRVQGKGKKHTINCSIRVFNDLEHWKMDSFHTKPDDLVFAGFNGKRPNTLNETFKTLLTDTGIPLTYQGEARTLYSLRHTYATFQLRSGVDAYHLAENMDTSIDMIKQHYGHVKGADRAKAVVLGHKRFK